MCGRYSISRTAGELVAAFEVDDVEGTGDGDDLDQGELAASYNVAPTDPVYAVLERTPRGEPDAAPRRQLRVAKWGLVPSWAKDAGIGSRLINARVETAAEKPAFRKAFVGRRCVLPADGYYEWYASPDAKPRSKKQPFFIRPADGGILAMAGLYELWRDESKDREDPGAWLWTVTVLTTEAVDDLGRIHDRMPMFVDGSNLDAWLDPARTDPDELRALLVPAMPGRLQAYPVSADVGNVRNNAPYLVEPIPADEVVAGLQDEARAGGAEPTLF